MFKPRYSRHPFYLDSYISAWESGQRERKDSWLEVSTHLSAPQKRYKEIESLKK